jgi:DNA-directed RNA polymerase sigma subunit (sigma70/sigma32)
MASSKVLSPYLAAEPLTAEQRARVAQAILAELGQAIGDRNIAMVRRRLQGESLTQIGRDYGVTRERVRQIVAKSLKRARATMLDRAA